MKVIIFSSSPNADGLTAACRQAAETGARATEAETVWNKMNEEHFL